MSVPVPISFTAIATVSGQAVGTPGTQILTLYDYNTELGIINTELKAIGVALTGMNAAITAISLELVKLTTFLTAVQSPSGDFRTFSPEDAVGTAIVTSALAKNIPPIVPAGGVTT
jgi:hypothetical protein